MLLQEVVGMRGVRYYILCLLKNNKMAYKMLRAAGLGLHDDRILLNQALEVFANAVSVL